MLFKELRTFIDRQCTDILGLITGEKISSLEYTNYSVCAFFHKQEKLHISLSGDMNDTQYFEWSFVVELDDEGAYIYTENSSVCFKSYRFTSGEKQDFYMIMPNINNGGSTFVYNASDSSNGHIGTNHSDRKVMDFFEMFPEHKEEVA